LDKTRGSCLAALLLAHVCLMLFMLKPLEVSSVNLVTSHRFPNNNVPTIDGYFDKASEWNTTRIEMGTPTDKVICYIGHDDKFLYILEDYVTDTEVYGTEARGDQGWVYIDLRHDGGSSPRADDFMIDLEWVDPYRHQYFVWRGDGKGWSKEKLMDDFYWSIKAKSSLSRSPNSRTSHMIYEFRIPLNFNEQIKVPLDFDEKMTIGLRLRVYDQNRQVGIEFPLGSSPLIPNDWATLTFSPVPIPEFTEWLLPTVLSTCLVMTFHLTRKPSRRKRR
jgi:hypothetical protein